VKNNKQLISVYMPTKNRGQLLKRAIDSVMCQDYGNFEMVVVDDGSTDDTPSVLSDYQHRYENFRFYRNDQASGVAAARNLAVSKCRGEFVTGLDDDDRFCVDRLSSLMTAYDEQYAFICSAVIWDYGDRTKVADNKPMIFNLQQQLSYNHATTQVLVLKERLLAIGGYDDSLAARVDYDAWTCLMSKYGKAKRIANPSYILSRDEGIVRITNSERNIKGNHQFVAKHKDKMNRVNLDNQAFWDMYAQNKPMGIRLLLRQMRAGYAWIKLKYFIRINFLPNWHQRG
jgi:glycosyltransferase involved in cell wall biosynthesis